ncbi:hypothetical protein O23A_p3130 [Aeromonas salmonicida]|nr:hypothetical protein O23A_p3130 [Aeromonas salmonicida]
MKIPPQGGFLWPAARKGFSFVAEYFINNPAERRAAPARNNKANEGKQT